MNTMDKLEIVLQNIEEIVTIPELKIILKKKLCGKYMQDCFEAMGIERDKLKFVYASEYVGDPKYWELVLRVSKATSVARVKRAMDIMGREENEAEKDLSKLFYPAMQVSDIYYLNLDVAYGGMDQRHAHMLARDVAKKLGKKPPVDRKSVV